MSVSQQYWQLSPIFAPKVRVAIDHLRNYSVVSAQVATLREEIHGRPRRCWQALDLAKTIDISHLSAERQARYLIDLAAAHAMRPQIGEAIHDLQLAEQITPEQTRTHRVARDVTGDLLQLSGLRPGPELRELAERFGVLP